MTAPDRLRALIQKATPGPWHFRGDDKGYHDVDVRPGHGKWIIIRGSASYRPEMERANLQLASLAPDLAAWAADAADMVFNQVMAGGVQCECGDCEVCDGVALLARLDRILGEQP